jgi:trigger factor
LESHGQIVPKLEGAAETGDYLTADIQFLRPDDTPLKEVKEVQFRLMPELRFQDGSISDTSALVGARPGDTRQLEAKLGSSVADHTLRGMTTPVLFRVNDLKHVRLPEINQTLLDRINVDSIDDLRTALRESLERRIRTEQRQAMRRQIVDQLLQQTPFELPSDLVSREEKSTIGRLVAQLKREGKSDNDIRAHEAQIRANAHETTLRSLKELLLLTRIADHEGIKVEEDDLALEIEAIAGRTGESLRRIRSRVEKEGGTDSLATQILEWKVINRIIEQSAIEDVEVTIDPEGMIETLNIAASAPAEESLGVESDNPQAEYPDV